jgi:hypothetical protein
MVDAQILGLGWLGQGLTAAEGETYYREAMELARSFGYKPAQVVLTSLYSSLIDDTGTPSRLLKIASGGGLVSSPIAV